ncbi:MAG TPA: SoxR reducing system RseC family protein [Gammaproteobacteria bacterium]|nr:SoxR reducing system RseC family protein [Gammaproteobacteria bacterium]
MDRSIPSHGCSAIGVVRQASADRVTVELSPPPRCEGCAGACLWYRIRPCSELTLAASGTIPIGTTVAVTLPDRYVVSAAVLVYGWPLAALLAGATVAAATFGTDLAAAAGAATALFAALLAASPLRRRLERATLRRLAVSAVV